MTGTENESPTGAQGGVQDAAPTAATATAPNSAPAAPHTANWNLDSLAARGIDPNAAYDSLVEQTAAAIHAAGFTHALIGLSGGIDSSLTATIAVDALGADCVHGALMPSPYSSRGSLLDANQLATNLNISTHTLPITPVFNAFRATLAPVFRDAPPDVTEENLQARIRGTLLMALSNKFDWFVLATGNLSEAAMGYATLYGDMVGSFAPLAPLLKAWVYELAHVRNIRAAAAGHTPPIPPAALTKEPSAELSAGQTDRDALGGYEHLDPVLYRHLFCAADADALIAAGFDADYVTTTLNRYRSMQFKRDLACPGAIL
ncbi:MAG: NAD(+) synthase [Actinomycetes bacterium]|jgi:NAD+ synthetase|nr:NAD(+) synthase [Actinomycetes bacterium]